MEQRPPETWVIKNIESLSGSQRDKLIFRLAKLGLTYSKHNEEPQVSAKSRWLRGPEMLPLPSDPVYVQKYELWQLADSITGANRGLVGKSWASLKEHFLFCLSLTPNGELTELDNDTPWARGYIPKFKTVTAAHGKHIYDDTGRLQDDMLIKLTGETEEGWKQYWDTSKLDVGQLDIADLGRHIDQLCDFDRMTPRMVDFWTAACNHFCAVQEVKK